jgi:hypothetical protein
LRNSSPPKDFSGGKLKWRKKATAASGVGEASDGWMCAAAYDKNARVGATFTG